MSKICKETNFVGKFWSYVDIGGDDECWIWKGAISGDTKFPCGIFSLGGRGSKVTAHRFLWEITRHDDSRGRRLMHTCRRGLCCNPRHIMLVPIPEERFWGAVSKGSVDECWEWGGSCVRGGYGQFSLGGKMQKAHRVAYLFGVGDIPPGNGWHGTCVLHRCDNRKCCNPAHLFLGTNLDNVRDRDMKRRGRTPPNVGECNPAAKLTAAQVMEIRRDTENPNYVLAEKYGVSRSHISILKSERGFWAGAQ